MTERTGDILSGLVVLAFAIAFYALSLQLPEGPGRMPVFISILLGMTSLLLIVRSLQTREKTGNLFRDVNWPAFFLLITSTLAAVFAIQLVGTFLTIFIFMAINLWFMVARGKGAKQFVSVVMIALGITALFWLVFSLVLDAYLPEGLLF